MTRIEYTDQVLSCVRRLTASEREVVRAEIDGHIEDHMASLLELGYAPELAEERTMHAMGDPAEVGREIDKQYPLRWLILSRAALAAVVMLACLCVQALLLDWPWYQLQNWLEPEESLHQSYLENVEFDAVRELDLHMHVGNDVLQVYQVGIRATGADTWEAGVLACNSDESWRGIPAASLWQDLRYTTSVWDGTEGDYRGDGRLAAHIPVTRADDHVTLRYEVHGCHAEMEVPLCWEEYDETD